MHLITKVLVIVLALFALSQQAAAGPMYTLKAFPGINPTIGDMTSITPGLTWADSATRTAPGQVVEGDWFLQAKQGSLHASVDATANGVYGAFNQFIVSSEFRYDDLVVSAPGSVDTVPVLSQPGLERDVELCG